MAHSCNFAVLKQSPKMPKCMYFPQPWYCPDHSHMTTKKGPSMQHLHHAKAKLGFERKALSCICCTLWAYAQVGAPYLLHFSSLSCRFPPLFAYSWQYPGKITLGIATEIDTNKAPEHGKMNLLKYTCTCCFSFSSSEGLLDMIPNNLPSQSKHCKGFAANAPLHH